MPLRAKVVIEGTPEDTMRLIFFAIAIFLTSFAAQATKMKVAYSDGSWVHFGSDITVSIVSIKAKSGQGACSLDLQYPVIWDAGPDTGVADKLNPELRRLAYEIFERFMVDFACMKSSGAAQKPFAGAPNHTMRAAIAYLDRDIASFRIDVVYNVIDGGGDDQDSITANLKTGMIYKLTDIFSEGAAPIIARHIDQAIEAASGQKRICDEQICDSKKSSLNTFGDRRFVITPDGLLLQSVDYYNVPSDGVDALIPWKDLVIYLLPGTPFVKFAQPADSK
jgi:hypothetical protein